MDRNILRQYLSGLAGANNRFLLENSRYLGNLPQNIVYNGLLYTLNLRENAFVNQFGHRIDASAAPAFITEARAFEQQNLAILDISASSSDSSSSRPTPSVTLPPPTDPIVRNGSNTETDVDVTWEYDPSNDYDGFIVQRSLTSDFKIIEEEIKTFDPAIKAVEDSSLTKDVTYYYRVIAYKGSSQSAPSSVVSITTFTKPVTPVGVTAPSGLTATSIAQTTLNLSWTDNSNNEIAFNVERSLNGSTYALLDQTNAGITVLSVGKLTQDSNYWFRVNALGPSGASSGYSNIVNIRTLPTIPAAPTGLSLLVGGTSQIALSWTDNATNEQYFNVFQTTDGGSSYVLGTTLGANSTAYIATGLCAGTTYGFRVNAGNTGGTSGFAGPEFATTLPNAPAAPSNLRFTLITAGRMDFIWDDNSTNESGFLVQSSTGGVSYSDLETTAANVNEYSARGLNSGTTYFFRVAAFNAGGTSAFSGATSAQTLQTAPSAPSSLVAYTSVPETKNYLRYTEGFTTSVSPANGGWTATIGSSTAVISDTSITAPDGSVGAALLRVNNNTIIGGIQSTVNESGVTANDLWSGSVWLRGNTSNSGSINVVARKGGGQFVIPSTIKILSGPGTVIPSAVGESHWNGVTGLSKTEWTRIAWNNITGWGPTGFTDVLLRLTVNFYSGTNPSAVTGDSIYAWGAQFERNPYPTAYLAATGGSFSERAFQGLTSQANLYWTDNSNNESGFLIERSTNDVTYAGITSVAANTTIYSDRGLSAGSTYFYRVSAFNAGGTSATTKSPSVVTYPVTSAPFAPSNFRFLSRAQNGFTLAWDDNSTNELGFIVQSSITDSGYATIATLGAGVTTYGATGLCAGSTYFFKVASYNSGGTSFSGTIAWETLPETPTTPSFTSISGTTNSITLNWNNVSNETGYGLYRSTTLEGTYTGITTLGANVTTFVNSGLSSGTTFFYKIDAFNSGGTSALSGATSFTTVGVTPIPTAPSNLRFTGRGSGKLIFAWDDNSADETGFVIESSLNGSSYTTLTTVGVGVTNYDASGLSSGTTYFFQVAAFNSGGTSSFAGPTAWKTLPTTPANFTATTGSTSSINLAWTDVTGEDGYVLNRGLTSAFTTFTGITLAANATGYSDVGLCAGTTYWYRMYAFLNDGGTSGFAGPTFAVTTAIAGGTPSAPTGFTATSAGIDSITLQWTDLATNEDGFLIYYRGIT